MTKYRIMTKREGEEDSEARDHTIDLPRDQAERMLAAAIDFEMLYSVDHPADEKREYFLSKVILERVT